MRRYKFYLAFENTNEPGYVTEKVYDALDAGVIPVYLGAPDVEGAVPRNSTLNAHAVAPEAYNMLQRESGGSSSGPVEVMAAALAARIAAMNRDPDELAKMHEWR